MIAPARMWIPVAVAVLVCSVETAGSGRSATTLEDFEHYLAPYDQIISSHAQTRPWQRFGEASDGSLDVTHKPQYVLSGNASAIYRCRWPATFGKLRRVLDEPIDLRGHRDISVLVRSSRPGTRTRVWLDLCDGRTTVLAGAPHTLKGITQELIFSIDPEKLVKIDGSGTTEDVLKNCRSVGIHIENSTGLAFYEVVIVDDVKLE